VEKVSKEQFYFVGNNLALDFINSRPFDVAGEKLPAWSVAAGLVDKELAWRADELSELADVRGRLAKMVAKLSSGDDISPAEIDFLNKVLKRGIRYVELEHGPEGYRKRLEIKIERAGDLLVPICESFVDLLCYGNPDHIRKCERPDCILYFYDTTKNHRRRWCSMAVCGNRAKATKFYRKKKSEIKV